MGQQNASSYIAVVQTGHRVKKSILRQYIQGIQEITFFTNRGQNVSYIQLTFSALYLKRQPFFIEPDGLFF